MAAYIAVKLIGDAHHQRQQQQLDQHPQEHIPHREDGKHDGVNEDSHNDHHQQEAGTAAWVMLGLGTHVFYRQLQTVLVTKDGLMLRTMVGEHPANILHPGYQDQIPHKKPDPQQGVHQVPQQNAVCPKLHKAG